MDTREFESRLKRATEQAEEALKLYLPKAAGFQDKLIEAMNYSLTAGGKRLRPILMQETYRMCGGGSDRVSDNILKCFMAAIEMIHTYSLVHDDLPAMDNDRYRRGRETTWCVYGDAMGILAGDALLNCAFETALDAVNCIPRETSCEERLLIMQKGWSALSVLARKAGAWGMIGGQAVDVMAENMQSRLSQEELFFIHEHKTAALIEAAMMVGAILAGADKHQVAAVEECAYKIGIAFQIQDDILDVIGDSSELGKPVGSDAQNNKQTYVTLNGLEASRMYVEDLSREAAAILDDFEGEHEFLKELILSLTHRRK